MICPNKNSQEFKDLVALHGENLAYYYWFMGSEQDPIKPSSAIDIERFIAHSSYAKYTGESLFKDDAVKDKETGKYLYQDTQYDSVTGDVIKNIQTRPYTATDTFGTIAANKLWKGLPDDTLLTPQGFISPMTKQEFALKMDIRYELGRAKGDLLHAYLRNHIEKTPQTAAAIENIFQESGILKSEMDWLTPANLRKIIEKTGTNYYHPTATDKIYTEKVVGSKELGWFGTMDMFIDHGDDVFSIHDLKTGLKFNTVFEDSFFKYGNASAADIFDTPRNRAKLQIMLYAFLIKLENPNARFRNLDILYIRDQWSIEDEDIFKSVNVPAYLSIIEGYLKNEKKYLYAKLKERADFSKLFEASSYVSSTKLGINPLSSSADVAKLKLLELQGLILWDKSVSDLDREGVILNRKTSDDTYVEVNETKQRREKITELMAEIIELKKDPDVHMSVAESNMGWLDRYLGSQSYSTNPYVQLYYKELSKAKQASRNQYESWVTKHDLLLKNLIESKGLKAVSRLVGGVNRDKLFEFAYKNDATLGRRLIHDKDSEWTTLSSQEQAYLEYVNQSISGVFTEEHSNLIDKEDKTPLAERIVTYRNWNGKKDVPVSNLALYNKSFLRNSKSFRPFAYYKGFFPRVAPQLTDITRKHGSLYSKDVLRFIWNRYTTNYFENVFDRWDNDQEAIPMKYLGHPDIDSNENYTLNLELAVKSFVKHYVYKSKMDIVYTIGQSMRIYLDAQREKLANSAGADPERLGHADRLISWFEDSINLHILGRKSNSLTLSSRNFGRVVDDRYQRFNWAKFLRSLKQFFAGPTMWLKPLTGLPNFVFASLVSIKEGIKGSLGISTSNARFTTADLASGFRIAADLVFWNGLSNESYRSSKVYRLMEKFGYLPDNHDWYTSGNELLTARNQAFTSRSLMLFHSVPEEIIATALFVAQMKAMTFTKEDGTETNMWDSYELEEQKLSDGTFYHTISWIGGKRGVINVGAPDRPVYEDVTELRIEEINAIKFLYEKIHGGYRGDERVAAEYYVMGELFLQLKKYMPSILKNVWASKGIRQTQGNFIEEVDENGNKVLKWKPQVIEGRYKILVGLLLNYLSIQHKTEGKKGNRFTRALGIDFDSSREWSNLSDAQKEDVKDFFITTAMYVMLLVGGMRMWDRDDDDTIKNIYDRIANDFAGNVNPLEIIKNIKNSTSPIAVSRGYQLLESSATLFWSSVLYGAGYTDEALTQQGNFRGAAGVKRNVHFLAAWYDITSKLENTEIFKDKLRGN